MRRLLPFVCVVVVVDTALYSALTPLLPHFEETYHLSKGGVGALVAAYGLGVLAGAIPGGILAARRGARGAVLAGLRLVADLGRRARLARARHPQRAPRPDDGHGDGRRRLRRAARPGG